MPRDKKHRRGRPSSSTSFRIVPIPHAKPDVRKLGRAFLALAMHQAEPQEKKEPDDGEA